ncbi:helix-turn-helix domain-containing protein [Streptomyces sp. 11-1-2]|uniref:helix-turn-helix domain-containing protein n=1 Tax=unclassified Streptomyces TaxID=2593676 RepID=UPI001968DD16|nr:helix-turn-helix domain-containing protein [Streptomyces sp. 11-1-2]
MFANTHRLPASASFRLRSAIVVLMSAQGQTVRDITSLMQVGERYVRDVIHAFNERGSTALDLKWSGDARRRSVSGYTSTSA